MFRLPTILMIIFSASLCMDYSASVMSNLFSKVIEISVYLAREYLSSALSRSYSALRRDYTLNIAMGDVSSTFQTFRQVKKLSEGSLLVIRNPSSDSA